MSKLGSDVFSQNTDVEEAIAAASTPSVLASKHFDTLALAQNSTVVILGDIVDITNRTGGVGRDRQWVAVDINSVTINGEWIVTQLDATIALVLRKKVEHFVTLPLALADVNMQPGDVVFTSSRNASGAAAGTWDVVLLTDVTLSTGAPAIGSIVAITGSSLLALQLRVSSTTTLAQMGASPDGSTDAMLAIAELATINSGVVTTGGPTDIFSIKSYIVITGDLTIKGEATLRVDNAQDFGIDCEGELTILGGTLDGNSLLVRSFVFCLATLPTIKGVRFVRTVVDGIIVNGTRTIGLQGFGASGVLDVQGCSTDGDMANFITAFGTLNWADPTSTEALVIIRDNPFVSCDSFFYSLKGFNDVQVRGNLYKNALHVAIELFSQDTGLTGTWETSSAATVDGGTASATAGAAWFRQEVTTVGKKYRLIFDAVADGTMTIFDGSTASGTIILGSTVINGAFVIEYTATNSVVTFRFDGGRTITFEKFRLIEENLQKTNATFDTFIYECIDNVWIGGERGPTAGIDTLNVTISDNTVRDTWIRAIAVDTERFDATAWDSIYPDSKALVNNNKLYDSGRALFATCRNLKFIDNDIDHCGYPGDFTSIASALRFNTSDFGSSQNARLYADGNTFTRMGSSVVMTVFNGTLTLGVNTHDSTNAVPLQADSGSLGKFKYIDGSVFTLETGDFDLAIDRKNYAMEYSTTGTFAEISVPTKTTRSCIGRTYIIAFKGTVGDIRFKALSTFATVNGGTLLVVPVGTKIATVVCVSEDNDFIIGFS